MPSLVGMKNSQLIFLQQLFTNINGTEPGSNMTCKCQRTKNVNQLQLQQFTN